MDIAFMLEALRSMLPGVGTTLQLGLSSIVLGGMFGVLLAAVRLIRVPIAAQLAGLISHVVRSTPLLVLIFLIYYGSGQFASSWRGTVFAVLFDSAYGCALLALSISTAAYSSEIFRGSVLAVPRGDIEAARAFAMSRTKMLQRVIIPVAMRNAIPAYGNEIILMLKGTALASTITVMEVTGIAYRLVSDTFRPIEVLVMAGMIYLTLSSIVVFMFSKFEKRLSFSGQK